MSIRQTDPRANYLKHKREIDTAIARVLDGGMYILGPEVAAFESEFSTFIGGNYGIAVGSGTEALHIALRACGIGQGDSVITVAHTAVATVAAIELCGAVPVLVDIDPETMTMDPNHLLDTIKELSSGRHPGLIGRPKAVIPVHLYGQPADMQSITSISSAHDLHIVEDCAQSHGAVFQGRKTGSWGDIAAFSFYPTKNLGALGDGGFLTTNNSQLAERARYLRQYGWRDRYVSHFPGLNSRLDEIQAAILRAKLPHLDQDNRSRQQIAAVYDRTLKDTHLQLPICPPQSVHVYHQYVIRSGNRDSLQEFLRLRGFTTSIHYPFPIHLQPAYRKRIQFFGSLEQSERAASRVLSLPIYPELDLTALTEIAGSIICWDREQRTPPQSS